LVQPSCWLNSYLALPPLNRSLVFIKNYKLRTL
jgi:hypothetical protein